MLNLSVLHPAVTANDLTGVSALLAIVADPAQAQQRLSDIVSACEKHGKLLADLTAAQTANDAKAAELTARAAAIADRESAVGSREAQTATKARENADREANLAAKEADLAKRETAVAAERRALDDQKARLRALSATV